MRTGTRKTAVAVVASLALVLGLLAVPAPAGAQEGGGEGTAADADAGQATQPSPYAGSVGINAHMVWYDVPTVTNTFQSLLDGGVTQVREDFNWEAIEPSNGRYEWWRTDGLMEAASATGMDVMGILAYSAPWASSRGTDAFALPRSNADYAEYAGEVARRYGPGGTFWTSHPELDPQPISALEIWNEPFGWWFSQPQPDPARYASLALAAAQAIESANPEVKVLIDGTAYQARSDGQSREWIREVLRAQPGLAAHVDVYSVHPYPEPKDRPPTARGNDVRWDFDQVELTRSITSSLGASRPLWITEVGWSTARDADGTVTEQQQADYLVSAIRRSQDRWSYIDRIYLYSFQRDGTNHGDREQFFGIRHRDGTPKPAWTAIQELLAPQPVADPEPEPEPPPSGGGTNPNGTSGVRLGPSRVAVRVLGSILYYDLA